ncbi:hypothetical protein [Azospirillum sp. B4]|uniref:hypothetical protein n=1 Tax=Azospirillum sp. B4 TaxID=95605 RepID=UPI0011DCB00E|nr:hypothetical protein [Azospirillum sp. B4]
MNWSFTPRVMAGKPWLLLTALPLAMGGCSPQQLYYTGQAWRQSVCREAIGDERRRCETENQKTYNEYQREKDTVK